MGKQHGLSHLPENVVWSSMKSRCLNRNEPGYPRYGGRGIKVSAEWAASFPRFIQDMGRRPSPKHTLERIDNNGDYTVENCRWATHKEQGQNRRDNHKLSWRGETRTMTDWAGAQGLNLGTLSSRIFKGWPIERALTEPPSYDAYHRKPMGSPTGRTPKGRKSKFTDDDIRAIRQEYIFRHHEFGQTALAKKYNVSQSAIGLIVRGKIRSSAIILDAEEKR